MLHSLHSVANRIGALGLWTAATCLVRRRFDPIELLHCGLGALLAVNPCAALPPLGLQVHADATDHLEFRFRCHAEVPRVCGLQLVTQDLLLLLHSGSDPPSCTSTPDGIPMRGLFAQNTALRCLVRMVSCARVQISQALEPQGASKGQPKLLGSWLASGLEELCGAAPHAWPRKQPSARGEATGAKLPPLFATLQHMHVRKCPYPEHRGETRRRCFQLFHAETSQHLVNMD